MRTALALNVNTPSKLLEKRSTAVGALRKAAPTLDWSAKFEKAAAIESDIAAFFKRAHDSPKGSGSAAATAQDLEGDAIGQLSFQHWALKPLNHLPFMIAALAIFKVWVVPCLAISTPLIAWILPYLLLKFVYALPIEQSQYFKILRALWTGQMGAPLPAPGDPLPSLFSTKSITQFLVFGASFLQSIIQPIQNAIHLHNTDRVFLDLGAKLVELRGITRGFQADLARLGVSKYPLATTLDDLDSTDLRRGFILVTEEPGRLDLLLADLARLEILWRLAAAESLFHPAVFGSAEHFKLEGLADLSLLSEGRPPPQTTDIALSASAQPHAVVTGPNGGGKSSFLRAVLQAVLLAHTYGYVPATAAEFPRLGWLASGLSLRDTPGVYSMFETEVKFAATCLKRVRSGRPGLVLFDELFHSTNPPDGTRTAERFLHALWTSGSGTSGSGDQQHPRHLFSIVSTHVFPLIEGAPSTVKAICCPAEETEKGDINYKYRLESGICRVSSVRKVWERFGLGAASSVRSKPAAERETAATQDAQ
jgi:energy-coupling factor transporter ATP-binding protein EcfA2